MIRPAIRAAALAVALVPLSYIESVHAAPVPSNDDIEDAIVVPGSGFSDHQNTRNATTAPGDPECAGNGHSVWYVYQPASDQLVHADTFGTHYDTTLSVYTVDPSTGSLVSLACNDDAVERQSAVDFQATAGEVYYFMVASFLDSPGGAMRFNLEVDLPFELDVEVTRGFLEENDQIVLEAELQCSRAAQVELTGSVAQDTANGGVAIFFNSTALCEGETEVVIITPPPGIADLFALGKATVSVFFSGTALADGATAQAIVSDKIKLVEAPED
jgi:hypothetical protein